MIKVSKIFFALLLLPLNFIHAEDLISQDKSLVINIENENVTGFIDTDACSKCVGKKFRLKISELNLKNKAIKSSYLEVNTEEVFNLSILKQNKKYTLRLEEKIKNKWQTKSKSVITLTTPSPKVAGINDVRKPETPIPPPSTSPNTLIPPTPQNTFIPIKVDAKNLDSETIYKGHINQQIYKATLTFPSNRDVILTKIVLGTPKELVFKNLKAYLNNYLYNELSTSTDQGLMSFEKTVQIPASSQVYITVYGDLEPNVPTGDGEIRLLGIATSVSKDNYEVIDNGGSPASSKISIREYQKKQAYIERQELGEGLVVEIYKKGTGKIIEDNKRVAVHYKGTLENGTKFDSSIDRGQPFIFTAGVGQVILGWDRSIKGRKVGDEYKVFIPSSLAYGTQGKGSIPPNSNLIFEITILDAE